MNIESIAQALKTTYSNPSLENVLQFLTQINVHPLGVGSTRVVVGEEERVVKFAWNTEGVMANQIEWKLWNQASSHLKTLLCPCIELRHDALVQARCVPIKAEKQEIVSELSRYGILDTAVNLGWFEDHVVCYDYSWVSPQLLSKLTGFGDIKL